MNAISDIDWGSVDADQDDTLPQTFVTSPHIRSLLSPRNWIVSGEKGSGKTAIKRAFSDPRLKVAHTYDVVGALDFDELEFETFQENLMSLAKVAGADPLRLLINFWIFTLITESAKILAERGFQPDFASKVDVLSEELHRIIHKSSNSPGKRFRSIIKVPVSMFIKDAPSDNAQEAILSFPLEYTSYIQLYDSLFAFLKERDQKLLIVLDGFDRVCTVARDPNYNAAIFEALCEAILKLRNEECIRERLHFKVLLPHDRFLPMLLRGVGERPVRDAVKIRDIHDVISWNRPRLLEFVEKRITATVGRSFPPGDALLTVLPASVQNARYTSVDENSFDYILRHTMWRPRHVQQHVVKLAELYPEQLIDHHMLRASVSSTCQDLVQEFIEEYSIDHPNIGIFLKMFSGHPNVMPYEDFTNLLSVAIGKFDGQKKWAGTVGFQQKVEALYRMGFFGIVHEIAEGDLLPPDVEYLPSSKLHGRRYYMEFYYRSTTTEPVYTRVPKGGLVAIHPIFFQHCKMRAHPTMIVG